MILTLPTKVAGISLGANQLSPRRLIFIVIGFVMIFLYKLSSQVGDSFKKNREKTKEEMEKLEEKINRGIIKSFADTIVKALK